MFTFNLETFNIASKIFVIHWLKGILKISSCIASGKLAPIAAELQIYQTKYNKSNNTTNKNLRYKSNWTLLFFVMVNCTHGCEKTVLERKETLHQVLLQTRTSSFLCNQLAEIIEMKLGKYDWRICWCCVRINYNYLGIFQQD